MSNRDNFSEKTKRILCLRVGGRCSNPSCKAITVAPRSDPEKVELLGDAAHISAAAPGGPRFNPDLSPSERKNIRNGIWLCKNCARKIDVDSELYPLELLTKWKDDAEAYQRALSEKKTVDNMAKRAEKALTWVTKLYHRCEKLSRYAESCLSPANPEIRRKRYRDYLSVREDLIGSFLAEDSMHQEIIGLVNASPIKESVDRFIDGMDGLINKYICLPDTDQSVSENNKLFHEVMIRFENDQTELAKLM